MDGPPASRLHGEANSLMAKEKNYVIFTRGLELGSILWLKEGSVDD
jgi:hypothetical protein